MDPTIARHDPLSGVRIPQTSHLCMGGRCWHPLRGVQVPGLANLSSIPCPSGSNPLAPVLWPTSMASLSAGPSADSTPTPHTPWHCKSREQGQESLVPLQPLWATPGWTAGRACRFRDHAVRCAYCLCLSGKLLTSLNPSSLIPKWEEYLLSLYRTSASTPSTAARLASLSIANSWSLLKLMSIESVMPSSHLTLCHPLLLLPVSSRVGT